MISIIGKEDEKGTYVFSVKKYWLVFTLVFFAVALIVVFWFAASGKTLVWERDGWNQHLKALVWYSRYLQAAVSGSTALPAWGFALGEGNDILATLHYYVIGDPFNLGSIFFSPANIYVYYEVMIIVRLFLAGVVFSKLMFETGKQHDISVLAGSLIYMFCYFGILNICKHPYFLNPLIFFPLLILGAEKLLKGKRPYVLIAAVCLSAVSNFYFFYMMMLALTVYVIVRIAFIYGKKIRSWLKPIGKTAAAIFLGAVCGAVILLPVAYAFLGDERLSGGGLPPLFYPLSYYRQLPSMFITLTNDRWLYMGYAAPALPAVFMLFLEKGRWMQKTLLILCGILLTFPIFGYIFNGFSYASNRWCFTLSLLIAYLVVLTWEELFQTQGKKLALLWLCLGAYAAACILLPESRSEMTWFALAMTAVFPIVAVVFGKTERRSWRVANLICMLAVIATIIGNIFWLYLREGEGSPHTAADAASMEKEFFSDETDAVRVQASTENNGILYRFSGTELTKNANLLSEISSTQFFWSISNPAVARYRRELGLLNTRVFSYEGYDNRPSLLALAAVRYYTVPGEVKRQVPYGFHDTGAVSDYGVFENANTLPLAYRYEAYMLPEDWDRMSMTEREYAMLEAGLVKEPVKALSRIASELPGIRFCPYTVESVDEKVVVKDREFIAKEDDAEIILHMEGEEDTFTSIEIEGLYYEDSGGLPAPEEEEESVRIRFTPSSGEARSLTYVKPESRWYSDRHDYCVYLGKAEKTVKTIRVKFKSRGIYKFEDIRIISFPEESFLEKIGNLSSRKIEELKIETDTVSAVSSGEKSGLLCFSIPYSAGWRAYVDGEEAELLNINLKNMGVLLDKGRHEVILTYHTPLLNVGILISVAGAGMFAVWIVLQERRLRLINRVQ